MHGKVKMSRSLLVVTLVFLTPAAVAAQVCEQSCGQWVRSPATIAEVLVTDDAGNPLPGEEARLLGWDLVLTDGSALPATTAIPIGEELAQALITNVGDFTTALVFTTGISVSLAPGQEVAIAREAKCKCRCTCKDAGGSTATALFDCSSNSDTCSYNGEKCVWVGDDNKVHEGAYEGCEKIWVLR